MSKRLPFLDRSVAPTDRVLLAALMVALLFGVVLGAFVAALCVGGF